MERQRAYVGAIVALGLWATALVPVLAEEAGWASLQPKTGTVAMQQQGRDMWMPVRNERRLGVNDRVKTAAKSAAQLTTSDNSIFAIGERTCVTVRECLYDGKCRQVNIGLDRGVVRVEVAKTKVAKKRDRLTVRASNAVMAAQGTNFAVFVNEDSPSGDAENASDNTGDAADASDNTGDAEYSSGSIAGDDELEATPDAEECDTRLVVFEGQVAVSGDSSTEPCVVKAGNTARVFARNLPVLNPQEFLFDEARRRVESIPFVRELLPLKGMLRSPENVMNVMRGRLRIPGLPF